MIGTISLAPWAGGGRAEFGKFFYFTCVLALFVFWCWKQSLTPGATFRWTTAEWLLCAGFLAVFVQLVPLPREFLASVSPRLATWLPWWFHDVQSSPGSAMAAASYGRGWYRLSLTPEATKIGLFVFTAHLLLFTVVAQNLRTHDSVRRMVRLVAIASLGMAVLGLAQYLSRTDKFAWMFLHPSRKASDAASGPFANANHFAHFLALGIAPWICWLQEHMASPDKSGTRCGPGFSRQVSNRNGQFLGLGAALTLVFLAGLFSKSRGGMVAIGLAVVICLGLLSWFGLVHRKLIGCAACLGILLAIGLTIHGGQELRQELSSLVAGSWEDLDNGGMRRNIWLANLRAAREFPFFGTGVGSHAAVYPLFMNRNTSQEFTHAESCYLQLLTETGCVGLGLTAMGIVLVFFWLVRGLKNLRDTRAIYCWIAIASSFMVSICHAAMDFPWYLTSCMSLTVILAASARGLAFASAPSRSTEQVSHRHLEPATKASFGWTVAAALGTVAFLPLILHMGRSGCASLHWNDYLVLALNSEFAARTPVLGNATSESQQDKLDEVRTRQMLHALGRVLHYAPHHPEANLRVATLLLKEFDRAQLASENAIGLKQISDAVYASQFSEPSARDEWLNRVLGSNRRRLDVALTCCQRALSCSPLEGTGYATLSNLSFLIDLNQSTCHTLLDQASRLRPHEPSILLMQGERLLQQGKLESTLMLWRQAFQQDAEFSQTIMRTVAPIIGCDRFVAFFEPNEAQLRELVHTFHQLQRGREVIPILPRIIEQIRQRLEQATGVDAAHARLDVMRYYRELGDRDKALQEAFLARDAASNLYEVHIALACELEYHQRFDEAVRELSWCAKRRPHDPLVHQLHAALRADRLRVATQAEREPAPR